MYPRVNQCLPCTYDEHSSILQPRMELEQHKYPKKKDTNIVPKWKRAGKILQENNHIKMSTLFEVMILRKKQAVLDSQWGSKRRKPAQVNESTGDTLSLPHMAWYEICSKTHPSH